MISELVLQTRTSQKHVSPGPKSSEGILIVHPEVEQPGVVVGAGVSVGLGV